MNGGLGLELFGFVFRYSIVIRFILKLESWEMFLLRKVVFFVGF